MKRTYGFLILILLEYLFLITVVGPAIAAHFQTTSQEEQIQLLMDEVIQSCAQGCEAQDWTITPTSLTYESELCLGEFPRFPFYNFIPGGETEIQIHSRRSGGLRFFDTPQGRVFGIFERICRLNITWTR